MSWAQASDGIRIHYDTLGLRSAAPVLMIQGLGADKHLCQPAFSRQVKPARGTDQPGKGTLLP